MTSLLLSRAPTRTTVAGWFATVAFLAVLARSTSRGTPALTLLVVAAVAGVVALTRPRLTAALVLPLGIIGTSFNNALVLPLGPLRLTPFELLSYALLTWLLLQWLGAQPVPLDPVLRRAVLGLMLAAVVGTGVVLFRHGSFTPAQAQLRAVLPYGIALPLAALYRTRHDLLRLERRVILTCLVLTGLILIGVAIGAPGLATGQLVTLNEVSEVRRVRPEFLNAVVLALFLLLVRGTAAVGAVVRRVALVLFTLLILLSYTRSTWIGLLAGLLLWWVGSTARRNPWQRAASVAGLVATAAVLFTVAAAGHLGSSGAAVTERIQSIGSAQAQQETSYIDRADENEAALATLRRSPVFGVGMDQPYGATVKSRDPLTKRPTYADRTFIHNQYLRVWLNLGALGLLSLTALAGWITVTAVRLRLHGRGDAVAHGLAPACALLALGVQAAFQTSLAKPSVVLASCVALALLHGWARQHREA